MFREGESSQEDSTPIPQGFPSPDKLKPEWVDKIEESYGGGVRSVVFQPGLNIILQGANDDALYVILRGDVSIIKQSDGGQTEQFTFGGRGAVVGEIRALNPTILRTRTVRAVTEVEAVRLYPTDLQKWNFEGKPWGGIHGFLRDLAEQRWRGLSDEDLKLGGLDFQKQLTEGRVQQEPEVLKWPDVPMNPQGPLSRRIQKRN